MLGSDDHMVGPGLSDGSEVIYHVGLGHPDPAVDDGKSFGVGVMDYRDKQLILTLLFAGVGQRLVPVIDFYVSDQLN